LSAFLDANVLVRFFTGDPPEQARRAAYLARATSVTGTSTVEDHVADALSVLDGLGVAQAWVIGHWWGGHLAMHRAVAAPERLLGAVVIDPLGAVPDGGEAEMAANLTSRLTPETAARVEEMDARLRKGNGTEADGEEMMRLVWPYYFASPESAPPMPATAMNNDVYAETFASIRQLEVIDNCGHFPWLEHQGSISAALARADLP